MGCEKVTEGQVGRHSPCRGWGLRIAAVTLCYALTPWAAVGESVQGGNVDPAPPVILAQGLSAQQNAQEIEKILDALQIEELLELIAEEELSFGEDLRADMLPEINAQRWERSLREQIRADAVRPIFVEAFAKALSAQEDLRAVTVMSRSPVMGKAVDLELKARRLLLDADIEAAAIERADQARNLPRYKALAAYIESLDLVETNVAGSLNSNLVLYRELAQGGAFGFEISDQEILSDVAAEADSLRADIEEWLTAYLFMAYHPLTEAEFSELVDLGESAEGRALYHAADRGYEAVFAYNSKVLARFIVARLVGEDL